MSCWFVSISFICFFSFDVWWTKKVQNCQYLFLMHFENIQVIKSHANMQSRIIKSLWCGIMLPFESILNLFFIFYVNHLIKIKICDQYSIKAWCIILNWMKITSNFSLSGCPSCKKKILQQCAIKSLWIENQIYDMRMAQILR